MGRSDIPLSDVRAALDAVGLWEDIASLPDGIATRITTNGGNLSAGQGQRLAIARAIVSRPRCLLLDEALDDLDPEARECVLMRVLGAGAPWTVVVATHDPEVARACTHRFGVHDAVLLSLPPPPPPQERQ